MLCNGE